MEFIKHQKNKISNTKSLTSPSLFHLLTNYTLNVVIAISFTWVQQWSLRALQVLFKKWTEAQLQKNLSSFWLQTEGESVPLLSKIVNNLLFLWKILLLWAFAFLCPVKLCPTSSYESSGHQKAPKNETGTWMHTVRPVC